jgi:FMN phosphatase YigB (HAD superfamily)
MVERFLFISLECLVRFPTKEKRVEIKDKHWKSLSEGFKFQKTGSVNPETDFIQQINQYISNRISDIDLFDATGFKSYEESSNVLKELNEIGFKVVVISDSSLKVRPLKILRSCGLEQFIYSLVTFSEIGQKKSSLGYFSAVQKFVGLKENSEIWVVGNKVNKEIFSAAKNGIKHIWINQLVTDIVNSM